MFPQQDGSQNPWNLRPKNKISKLTFLFIKISTCPLKPCTTSVHCTITRIVKNIRAIERFHQVYQESLAYLLSRQSLQDGLLMYYCIIMTLLHMNVTWLGWKSLQVYFRSLQSENVSTYRLMPSLSLLYCRLGLRGGFILRGGCVWIVGPIIGPSIYPI